MVEAVFIGLFAGACVGALIAFAIAITTRDGIWPDAIAILILIGMAGGAVFGALVGLTP